MAHPNCPECRGLGYVRFADGEAARARVCPCSADCPECGGAGVKRRKLPGGYEEVAVCACRGLHDRVALFSAAGIPARYALKTVEEFKHLGGNQGEVRSAVAAFQREFDPAGRGLVLCGGVGVGKTHLLSGVIAYLTLERGMACRFVEFTHLMAEIREGYGQGLSDASFLGPLARVPVLAIDELGKGRCSEWEQAMLDEVISARYNAERTILATTNFAVSVSDSDIASARTADQALAAAKAQSLEERVTSRVFSRLEEMCGFMSVIGPDYRATTGRPAQGPSSRRVRERRQG